VRQGRKVSGEGTAQANGTVKATEVIVERQSDDDDN